MKNKKKRRLKSSAIINEIKINRKNKKLMMDKILSYNPMLIEGINIYKDAKDNFLLLIFLGALLVEFPLISFPCCMVAIFFIMRMLQYIKYKSINNIVTKLAKDLSSKGVYDMGKTLDMIENFKLKYGDDIIEYKELVSMINKYEELVVKIESVLNGHNMKVDNKDYGNEFFIQNGIDESSKKGANMILKDTEGNKGKEKKYCIDFKEKFSVLYKKEDGEIKEVNKAIEFFDCGDDKTYSNKNAVILKNVNKDNKNLTIYLYRKSSFLEKNVL